MWEREQSEKMCVAWDFVPVICWKKYIYPLLVQWVYTSRILMSSRGAAILLYSLIIFTIFALPTPHSIFESKLAHFFYYITFACVERLLVYKRHVIIYIYGMLPLCMETLQSACPPFAQIAVDSISMRYKSISISSNNGFYGIVAATISPEILVITHRPICLLSIFRVAGPHCDYSWWMCRGIGRISGNNNNNFAMSYAIIAGEQPNYNYFVGVPNWIIK